MKRFTHTAVRRIQKKNSHSLTTIIVEKKLKNNYSENLTQRKRFWWRFCSISAFFAATHNFRGNW